VVVSAVTVLPTVKFTVAPETKSAPFTVSDKVELGAALAGITC
jgi:hypothetical protein